MSNSQQVSLLKRSIFWLCVLIAVVGLTYYYQENLFKDGFDAITASNTTKELPIYNVQTNKKQVALSFDAAWGNEDTRKILDILKKYKINVTFFMTGGWVESYPDDVKAIKKAGHDLGNHSENHKHMPTLSTSEMCNELTKVTDKVKKLTGTTMCLFRPPYGDYDNNLIIQAKNCGYYTIQWNVDSLDWKESATPDSIFKRVTGKVTNGSIVLFHNDADHTPEALPGILKYLKEQGYEFVFISDLILKDSYTIDHTGKQCPAAAE